MQSYQELSRIGQGTYGVVCKAQHVSNREVVAIKHIKISTREEGIPSSAIREIALLKELKHENIIRLYDVIHSQFQLSLIFEYCEWDLRRYMDQLQESKEAKKETILGSEEWTNQVIKFSHQLLKAIAYMHENGIIHRDIKPQNILINRKHELKLADFGLARSTFIPVDKLSTEVITQWYRPPEILLRIKDYSYPVDTWSAGCVIAEMITMQPLFQCSNNEEQLERLAELFGREELVRVFPDYESELPHVSKRSSLREELSVCQNDELLDLIERLLHIDPEKRISPLEALQLPMFTK